MVPPKRHILKTIRVEFLPRRQIGVLGLNGAGKFTLLRIMAGLIKICRGRSAPAARHIKIGHLPQEPQLNPEHTVMRVDC
ncbi:ATP-binding cassette domain-containing protein [Salmonella enterica subsp. enterica serovar Weltevreden]|nr:ATP-binding cassette domain-containing protein [Salmonella enterica subsp. enterica serovar Weltevreden]